MKKVVYVVIITLVLLAGVSLPLGGSALAADLMVSVHPDIIQIGANYNGEVVTVSGRIPEDATALVRVTGKPEHYRLKQKGRAFGLLWMNLGSVEISNVPDVFLLYLPGEAGNSPKKTPAAWKDLNLGIEGLRQQAEVLVEGEDKEALFDEFIKLKQQSGLYGTNADAIWFEPDGGAIKSFKASMALPSALPQGEFNVEVFVIENGVITNATVHKIEAREVGMPAWISTMAFHHGTLYGVLAVLTAVLAGLLTGVMFKGEKGAH